MGSGMLGVVLVSWLQMSETAVPGSIERLLLGVDASMLYSQILECWVHWVHDGLVSSH